MNLASLITHTVLKYALVLLLLVSPVLQAQDNETPGAINELRQLRQQAMALEQKILIASEEERQAVAEQADQLLARFDRRIQALAQDLDRRRDEMTSAESRYSSELMQALGNQRQDVSRRLDQVRSNDSETWDHVVYNFTSAYESFYEMWEDVEANFGLSN